MFFHTLFIDSLDILFCHRCYLISEFRVIGTIDIIVCNINKCRIKELFTVFLTEKDLIIKSLDSIPTLDDVILLIICYVLIQAVRNGLQIGGQPPHRALLLVPLLPYSVNNAYKRRRSKPDQGDPYSFQNLHLLHIG